VGVPRTEALVRLYDTVNANADWLPRGLGVGPPLIKPKGIDDVPIVTLTLYAKDGAGGAMALERVAHSLELDLKRVPGTREVATLGGPGRAVLVELDPQRLARAGLTVAELRQALQAANMGALVERYGPAPRAKSSLREGLSSRNQSCPLTPSRWLSVTCPSFR